MDIIDSAKDGAEEQFKKSQKAGRLQVVLISLNPEEDNRRYRWINRYKGSVFSLLEETDFGAHTEKQIKKIEFIKNTRSKSDSRQITYYLNKKVRIIEYAAVI